MAAPENALKARDSLFDEFKRLVEKGIPESELEDAKASFALQVKTRLASDSAVAGMVNSGLYLDRTMQFHTVIDPVTHNTRHRVGQVFYQLQRDRLFGFIHRTNDVR